MRIDAYDFKPLANGPGAVNQGQQDRSVVPFKEFDLSRLSPPKVLKPEKRAPAGPVAHAESEPFLKLRRITGGVSHAERLLLNSVAGLYRNHSSLPESDAEHRIELRV